MGGWLPIGGEYNVIWLAGVIGVALIALARTLFGSWFVPKNPAFVEKCINTLHDFRQKLTAERPRLVDPVTGVILIRPPNDLKELLELLQILSARHSVNREIVRQLLFVLFPRFRSRIKRASQRTDATIGAAIGQLSVLKEKLEREEDVDDAELQRFVELTFKAYNAIIDFERQMLNAIDESLDCWSRRIGGN